MIDITLDSVREGLLALVRLEGEGFIYQKSWGVCTYVREGRGDCIVGRFLIAKGVPVDRLEAADAANHGNGVAARSLLRQLKEEGVVAYDELVLQVLDNVQHHQDIGYTWGFAVSEALAGASLRLPPR